MHVILRFVRSVSFALMSAWQADRAAFICHLSAQLLTAVFPVASVRITALLVDAVAQAPARGLHHVAWLAALQSGLLVLQYIVNTSTSLFSQKAREQTELHLLARLVERTQAVPFDERQTTRFNQTLVFLRSASVPRIYPAVDQLLTTASALVTMVGILSVVRKAHLLLGLGTLLATLPTAIAGLRATRLQFEAAQSQSNNRQRADYFYRVLTSREYSAEVQFYRAASFLVDRWRHYTGQIIQSTLSLLIRQSLIELPTQLLNYAVLAVVTVVLASYVASGTLTLGDYVAVAQALFALQGGATHLYRGVTGLVQTSLHAERLLAFLQRPRQAEISVEPPALACALSGTAASEPLIEAVNVSYRYPGSTREALQDISLRVAPRSLTVIVGANGAGKTTLLHLLAGLVPPTSGEVRVHPSLGAGHHRTGVALVAQDFARFNLSLYENIALAPPGSPAGLALTSPAAHALREAGGEAILERMGLDAVLGPEMNEGQELSRGEWQRIAIARGLYRRPNLLLMDEPTASADPSQRQAVWDLIGRLKETMAVVVITHDVTIAEKADQILVLRMGRIVGRGRHEELLETSVWYRWLLARHEVRQDEEMEVPV